MQPLSAHVRGEPSQAICCGWALTVMLRTVCCRKAGGGARRAREAGADAGAFARRTRGENAGCDGPPWEGSLGVEGGGRCCRALIKACVSGSPWACQRPCACQYGNERARGKRLGGRAGEERHQVLSSPDLHRDLQLLPLSDCLAPLSATICCCHRCSYGFLRCPLRGSLCVSVPCTADTGSAR